ncbi:alpha/beta hydrolase family protein [Sandaracinobacteroides saxicola]|uniref:Alpha/beta hydrolase n=1 Tax=Sandaracinobacteroides saxicola TaxID=2759707 RepID=A0A7G5IL86_9SPHN|nr:alpha/beta hydrolase [Sandaracinobacteroides saxicola]QMW24128.1 alpha/beta hydrolase [Sandaracinobacteroides saxicola]
MNNAATRRAILTGGAALAFLAAATKMPKGTGLKPPAAPAVQTLDIRDADGRIVPIRVWRPGGKPLGTLLFSHGANSNAAKYDALTAAFADAGWLTAAILHADSPDRPEPRPQGAAGLARRLVEAQATLDWLSEQHRDLPMVAAGHSFGALIALILAGARTLAFPTEADPRVRAALAFSPPGAFPGFIDAKGMAKIARPIWVQTGTADALPPMIPDWQSHRLAFDNATVTPRLLWIGDGVDHYFGNRIGRPERPFSEPQARLFQAATDNALDFAAATALADPAARARLDTAPAGVTITLKT